MSPLAHNYSTYYPVVCKHLVHEEVVNGTSHVEVSVGADVNVSVASLLLVLEVVDRAVADVPVDDVADAGDEVLRVGSRNGSTLKCFKIICRNIQRIGVAFEY